MFIYLASPYSSPHSFVRFERYIEAMKATYWLIKSGESVFSPIVHCHSMASVFDMPTNAEFWESYNYGILKHAEALYVLHIDHAEESVGVAKEVKFAKENNIPCWLIKDGHKISPL